MSAPPARLLDLSRLVSRAGRTLTGIDRVELAYARRFAEDGDSPGWGLVRTHLGYLLLGPEGVAALAERAAAGGDWGPIDRLSRLARSLDDGQRRGQSFARARARARAAAPFLGRMLRRQLPPGTSYVNVGHSNLTARVTLAARAMGGRTAVMIHDTIPLDHPEWSAEGVPEAFAGKLRLAARAADLVICPSAVAAAAVARQMAAQTGRPPPPVLVAPLGVTPAIPDPAALPPELRALPRPYLVALGTIEPRKDVGFLLDLWEEWPGEPPPLLLIGRRGWRSEALFARLDRGVRGVREAPGLADGAVAALVAGAAALLMPSRAEGYGLPALEALALGTPVLCGDLAIFRETLGGRAIALPPGDRYAWGRAVREALAAPRPAPVPPPGWGPHFKAVLSRI
jgi:glycosyltransferase involved in cell wall biosynthesis